VHVCKVPGTVKHQKDVVYLDPVHVCTSYIVGRTPTPVNSPEQILKVTLPLIDSTFKSCFLYKECCLPCHIYMPAPLYICTVQLVKRDELLFTGELCPKSGETGSLWMVCTLLMPWLVSNLFLAEVSSICLKSCKPSICFKLPVSSYQHYHEKDN